MTQRTLERLRAEFAEMPGLSLTRDQVQRFCGVDEGIVQVVLDALVDSRFLRVTPGGLYSRLTEGPPPGVYAAGPPSRLSSTAMKRFLKWSAIVASAAIGAKVLTRTIWTGGVLRKPLSVAG